MIDWLSLRHLEKPHAELLSLTHGIGFGRGGLWWSHNSQDWPSPFSALFLPSPHQGKPPSNHPPMPLCCLECTCAVPAARTLSAVLTRHLCNTQCWLWVCSASTEVALDQAINLHIGKPLLTPACNRTLEPLLLGGGRNKERGGELLKPKRGRAKGESVVIWDNEIKQMR